MSTVKNMKQLNDILSEVGTNLVLIDFFANWCGPCKEISPKLDELGKQLGNLTIVKINVDECEEIVEAYDVSVLPTFVILRSKQKLETFTGNDFEKLKETVMKLSRSSKPSQPAQMGRSQHGNTIRMEQPSTAQQPRVPTRPYRSSIARDPAVRHQPSVVQDPAARRRSSFARDPAARPSGHRTSIARDPAVRPPAPRPVSQSSLPRPSYKRHYPEKSK